ncbi:MAG: insulinase family protein, partial [Chloroflexi bacterium]|nr:insulinase family protein [Chloroflexota bacterium]
MNSFSFDKFTLSNGLDVILQEDHALPVAAVNIWYHVGSKDEEPGRTGFAHLFEHVMFEGSKNHNQSFFDPLQKVGAVLNGSTSNDRTNYWEDVPSNYLELALWLESDRMGFLLDALDQGRFDIQREVVKNERRQSYENRPYGMAGLVLQSAVFPTPHPYSWPVIGSQEDLDSAALEDIHAFFRRFYAPTNASLAIVGDIDLARVKDMVERYFGDIPPGPSITRVGKMDSDLRGRVSLTMQDRVQLSRLYLVWPTSPAFSEDEAPLDMLSTVLGDGKSSRFYRSLVYEKQIAKDARVMHHAQEIAGEFQIQVTANPGHSLEEIEEAVRFELDRIVKEPPTEKEMTRARNRVQSHYVRQTQKFGGFGGRADLLNSYNTYLGDPGYMRKDLDRYLAVSSEDVVRVASTVLGRDHVGLSVLPEESLSAASSVVDRASAPAASGAPSFEPPVPERRKLGNGMSVVVLERTGVSLVAMGLLLRSGAVDDPTDQPGLTDMMMALLPEGTTNRDSRQISDDMEFLGAQLSSEASREHAILSTEALTQHWAEALEIISDVAKNASFPQEEIERVRREHITDLQRISDNPTTIALRASRRLVFGADTRYGHPLSGTEESVGSLDREGMVKHFGR